MFRLKSLNSGYMTKLHLDQLQALVLLALVKRRMSPSLLRLCGILLIILLCQDGYLNKGVIAALSKECKYSLATVWGLMCITETTCCPAMQGGQSRKNPVSSRLILFLLWSTCINQYIIKDRLHLVAVFNYLMVGGPELGDLMAGYSHGHELDHKYLVAHRPSPPQPFTSSPLDPTAQ